MSKAHPGFKKAAASIERKEGVSEERADAILAAGAHKASAKAKRENPRLEHVIHPMAQKAHDQHLAKVEAFRKARQG